MAQEQPRFDDQDLERIAATPDASLRARRLQGLTRSERGRLSEIQRSQSRVQLEMPKESVVPGIFRGMGQGLQSSAIGASEIVNPLLRQIPFVGEAFATPEQLSQARERVQPEGRGEKLGFGLEQILEVLIPSGAINRARVVATQRVLPIFKRLFGAAGDRIARVFTPSAVEAGVAATEAKIQGGDPRTSAALAGAIPVVGAVARVGGRVLRRSALTDVGQSLKPPTIGAKEATQDIQEEFLERSRRPLSQGGVPSAVRNERLLDVAQDRVIEVNRQLDEFADVKLVGRPDLQTEPMLRAIDDKIEALTIRTRAGRAVIPNEAMAKKLGEVRDLVAALGDTVDQVALRKMRQQLDRIAHQGKNPFTTPEGTISREAYEIGATAIRRILNAKNPDLAKLNTEFVFWKRLEDILQQRELREVGQMGGLFSAGVGGMLFGGILGGDSAGTMGLLGGGAGGFFVGAAIGRRLIQAWRSPLWQRVNMRTKDRLAQAIMSGNATRVEAALGRVFAVEFPRLSQEDES